jgi:hypothetical protein
MEFAGHVTGGHKEPQYLDLKTLRIRPLLRHKNNRIILE